MICSNVCFLNASASSEAPDLSGWERHRACMFWICLGRVFLGLLIVNALLSLLLLLIG